MSGIDFITGAINKAFETGGDTASYIYAGETFIIHSEMNIEEIFGLILKIMVLEKESFFEIANWVEDFSKSVHQNHIKEKLENIIENILDAKDTIDDNYAKMNIYEESEIRELCKDCEIPHEKLYDMADILIKTQQNDQNINIYYSVQGEETDKAVAERQIFGLKMKVKVLEKEFIPDIGLWAYNYYQKNIKKYYPNLDEIINVLKNMALGPEYEFSYAALEEVADRITYINEVPVSCLFT